MEAAKLAAGGGGEERERRQHEGDHITRIEILQSTAVADAWARRAAGPMCSDDVTL